MVFADNASRRSAASLALSFWGIRIRFHVDCKLRTIRQSASLTFTCTSVSKSPFGRLDSLPCTVSRALAASRQIGEQPHVTSAIPKQHEPEPGVTWPCTESFRLVFSMRHSLVPNKSANISCIMSDSSDDGDAMRCDAMRLWHIASILESGLAD